MCTLCHLCILSKQNINCAGGYRYVQTQKLAHKSALREQKTIVKESQSRATFSLLFDFIVSMHLIHILVLNQVTEPVNGGLVHCLMITIITIILLSWQNI